MSTQLRFAAFSDIGLIRSTNQDSGYASPNLLVLADGTGVGGRKAAAARTQVQGVTQVVNAPAKAARFGLRPLEQHHGRAHGGFGAKARQARKLLYQGLERFGNSFVHGFRRGRAA